MTKLRSSGARAAKESLAVGTAGTASSMGWNEVGDRDEASHPALPNALIGCSGEGCRPSVSTGGTSTSPGSSPPKRK